jgi:hypothetical protein
MMSRKKNKNQQNNNFSSHSPNTASLDYDRAYKEARSLINNVDRKFKTVAKGMQYDWLNNTSWNNVVYPRDKIPDRLLRLIERRNGIVGSIITLRIQQMMEFSGISHNKDIPGWEFVLKDDEKILNSERKKQKEFLENFLVKTRRDDYAGIEPKHGALKDLMTKYVRDRILIDKVCWEIERDRKGQAAALWVLDGATILPILPGGFYGSTSQIGVGISVGFNRLSDEIRKAKLENIPPTEEISYIQELLYGSSGGGITAAFRETDLIYDLSNELNDIRFYKQGFSVTEKANLAIVAFINSLTFNSNGLSRGSIPKIALAMGKDSSYTQEQLEDAQDEWMSNFQAMDGQWNIPLLNGDAKVLQLLPNNRDMEYQKYMEFTGALTCAIMGVDSAEIGLRLNQAQSVLSENQDAKQLFSKERGLKDILGGFRHMVIHFLEISNFPFSTEWMFRFNGLSTEDKGFEADLRKKSVETNTTLNELRALDDKPPLPNGDIVLHPQYIQYILQKEQMAAGQSAMGSESGQIDENSDTNFDDEEIGNMIDDAMGGMEKAIRLI